MIDTPEEVRQGLAARHPEVTCVYDLPHKLFRLVVFWKGKFQHLRWIEMRHEGMPSTERGAFVWPDLYNTVEWLNQTDRVDQADNSWQLKALQEHLLDRPTQHKQKIKKAKMSEMIRLGLAPELQWAFKKDKVGR